MNFLNAMQGQLNQRKTLTENGAVAYATSGNPLTDFLFAITTLRTADETLIEQMFSRAFQWNPILAMRMLFWIRDCREGIGERRIFRVCMRWVTDYRQIVGEVLFGFIPEYGRWDDLWCLLDTSIKGNVISLVDEQLQQDKKGKPSLLAKWMPSLNTSSRETRKLAEILRDGLGLTPREYRKTLSGLRKTLDLVEVKMSAKQWGKIDYESVPSVANVKYKNAFLRNDELRRRRYLDSLSKGNAKINASVLQPHEIVSAYRSEYDWMGYNRREIVKPYDETLEQLWLNLKDITIGNTLVVRDGSGSMARPKISGNTVPLDVATALAIYMADHNTGDWKGKFITFSNQPRIVDLSNCKSLREKLIVAYHEAECRNTDVEATMLLILNTARKIKCSQEDLPKNVVVISDMQYDVGTYGHGVGNKTLFEDIAMDFKLAGYTMPRMIFWNVAGRLNNTIPMQENESGLVLCSGFSTQLLRMVMSGKIDPLEVLLDTINDTRYDVIEEALKGNE